MTLLFEATVTWQYQMRPNVSVPRVLEGELVIDTMEFNPRLSMSGSEEFQKLANSLEEEVSSSKQDLKVSWQLKVMKSWPCSLTNSEENLTFTVYGDENCL
jgi:hypothetical protein